MSKRAQATTYTSMAELAKQHSRNWFVCRMILAAIYYLNAVWIISKNPITFTDTTPIAISMLALAMYLYITNERSDL